MIDLNKEKENVFSAQERYDICSFATMAAEDNGFLNSFIFERAIYCYAAIILIEEDEEKDILREKVSENLIDAWDYLIENNIIQEIRENHGDNLDILAEEAQIWFDEYAAYVHSARGILSFVEEFMGNSVTNAADTLSKSIQQNGVGNIIDLADHWGMNRGEILVDNTEVDEGLFNG